MFGSDKSTLGGYINQVQEIRKTKRSKAMRQDWMKWAKKVQRRNRRNAEKKEFINELRRHQEELVAEAKEIQEAMDRLWLSQMAKVWNEDVNEEFGVEDEGCCGGCDKGRCCGLGFCH
jgi:predicted RNase H-like nuclease (RuvC/YqgF family)